MPAISRAQLQRQRRNAEIRALIAYRLELSNSVKTKSELADHLHFAERTLYAKLANPDLFTLKELCLLFQVLQFPPDDILKFVT